MAAMAAAAGGGVFLTIEAAPSLQRVPSSRASAPALQPQWSGGTALDRAVSALLLARLGSGALAAPQAARAAPSAHPLQQLQLPQPQPPPWGAWALQQLDRAGTAPSDLSTASHVAAMPHTPRHVLPASPPALSAPPDSLYTPFAALAGSAAAPAAGSAQRSGTCVQASPPAPGPLWIPFAAAPMQPHTPCEPLHPAAPVEAVPPAELALTAAALEVEPDPALHDGAAADDRWAALLGPGSDPEGSLQELFDMWEAEDGLLP